MHELGSQHGGIGYISHYDDDAADSAVFAADRAEIDRELPADAVASHQRHIEVIHLLPASHGGQRVTQRRAARRSTQIGQRMSENLGLLKTQSAPAPVGITDHAIGIGHQNQALGVTQNLAGEIALFLQFGLRLVKTCDIEHQAAVLHDVAGCIAHSRSSS